MIIRVGSEILLLKKNLIYVPTSGSSWDIPLWDFPYGIWDFGNPNPIWDFLGFFSDKNNFFKVKRKFSFIKKLLETGCLNCFWLQVVSLNIFIQIRHIHLSIIQPPKFWPLCVLEVEFFDAIIFSWNQNHIIQIDTWQLKNGIRIEIHYQIKKFH